MSRTHLQMVPTSSVQYKWLAAAATHNRRWRLDATVIPRAEQIVRAEHQGFDFVIVVLVVVVAHSQHRIRVPMDDVRRLVELVQLVHAWCG